MYWASIMRPILPCVLAVHFSLLFYIAICNCDFSLRLSTLDEFTQMLKCTTVFENNSPIS